MGKINREQLDSPWCISRSRLQADKSHSLLHMFDRPVSHCDWYISKFGINMGYSLFLGQEGLAMHVKPMSSLTPVTLMSGRSFVTVLVLMQCNHSFYFPQVVIVSWACFLLMAAVRS